MLHRKILGEFVKDALNPMKKTGLRIGHICKKECLYTKNYSNYSGMPLGYWMLPQMYTVNGHSLDSFMWAQLKSKYKLVKCHWDCRWCGSTGELSSALNWWYNFITVSQPVLGMDTPSGTRGVWWYSWGTCCLAARPGTWRSITVVGSLAGRIPKHVFLHPSKPLPPICPKPLVFVMMHLASLPRSNWQWYHQ